MILPTDRDISRRGRHFGAWMNPDGSEGQRIYARPIHRRVQEAGGSGQEWVAMDNCILAPWEFQVDGRVVEISIGDLQAKSATGAVRAVASGQWPVVSLTTNNQQLTTDLYPGIDLAYEMGLAGLKETIVIGALPALSAVADGFTTKWITISGRCSVASDQREGLARKEATFRDREGNPGKGYLTWDGDKFELGVEAAWLYSAALPVAIDPTIMTEGNDISLWYQGGSPPLNEWRKCFVKFDITSIPDDAIISAATLNLYVTLNGSGDVTLYSKRFNSQAWTEGDAVATLDAIAMGANLDSHAENGFTLNAYYGFNVRKGDNSDGLEADVSGGNQYFTGGLWYSGTMNATLKDNGTWLHCGSGGNAGAGLHAEFNSAEGASIPYLDITYTVPSAGGHFAVMV